MSDEKNNLTLFVLILSFSFWMSFGSWCGDTSSFCNITINCFEQNTQFIR